MQKLWYNTNDALGHAKALQSMKYLQTTKQKTQGRYQSVGLPKNPFIFQMM
jgi:hypothetical protein